MHSMICPLSVGTSDAILCWDGLITVAVVFSHSSLNEVLHDKNSKLAPKDYSVGIFFVQEVWMKPSHSGSVTW